MTPNGATFDGNRHTRTYFYMIPRSKLTFSPAFPRYVTEDLTGASGELDHTDTLTGEVAYNDREGVFSFLVLNDSNYLARYKAIKAYFNGTERICVLDDDPEHEYVGRFYLSSWKSYELVSECEITYIVEPFRYSEETIDETDWLWDEMNFSSNDYLYFSSFMVDGQKARTLVNEQSVSVTPTIICTADMAVKVGNITHFFNEGSTRDQSFQLSPGRNLCTFYGNGNVRVVYPKEVVP